MVFGGHFVKVLLRCGRHPVAVAADPAGAGCLWASRYANTLTHRLSVKMLLFIFSVIKYTQITFFYKFTACQIPIKMTDKTLRCVQDTQKHDVLLPYEASRLETSEKVADASNRLRNTRSQNWRRTTVGFLLSLLSLALELWKI